MAKQIVELEVQNIMIGKEARTATLRPISVRSGFFATLQLDVPVEQSCNPGDIISIEVGWID